MLIFVRGTCCVLLLFVKHVACTFFSLWNLYIYFFPLETDFVRGTCCVLIIFCSWKVCMLILVHATLCMLSLLFVKLVN